MKFENRHIGINNNSEQEMLKAIGIDSIDALIDKTIPEKIRLKSGLNLPEAQSEFDYLNELKETSLKNKLNHNFIGQGYYGTITPSVILRNILENPGWYTSYTPYQAEISQGRLEALLNFQTVVSDLTGLPIANASLLDEGTAAAEAMIMLFNGRSRAQVKEGINKFFISEHCFKQTIDVMITRATALGVDYVIGNPNSFKNDGSYFGMMIQYPDCFGSIENKQNLVSNAKADGLKIVVATDLMALTIFQPPGEWGADVVVGTSQRFGVPMGFGGPHAAFFATHEEYRRHIPGRIIGVSVDKNGKPAYRMALQTREQHIRRDKATSNICTAQALLAIMAGMYAVYHGPAGIKKIATEIHNKTKSIAKGLIKGGYKLKSAEYFDTITIEATDEQLNSVVKGCEANGVNVSINKNLISVSVDEATTIEATNALCNAFGIEISNSNSNASTGNRTSEYLKHEVFHKYHSETEMMRYLKRLENKDISLTHSMISLGSCTMKLNAATELMPITWPEFANVHPFVPESQSEGYMDVINDLEKWLCEITGFSAVSFQPNSGAQGEYAGLLAIRSYLDKNNGKDRTIALIPSSAHGTNPASAVMAGFKVVVVKCDEKGNIMVDDLKEKAEKHKDELGALLVTYPSTHGVFEASIMEITQIIHDNGGQVYMDGANMNAQVGLTNPANIGADVCHLNLHKTFAIPHGGGGPGVGPIGVAAHLVPHLPGHNLLSIKTNAVSAAPFGSSLILLISYAYCKMLGKNGVTNATRYAILNANYLKTKLESDFDILYQGENGTVAHEMILDCRMFKKTAGVEVEDIAKRLIDYGFHAPTVSFPVAGTLMIEPTESESKEELDRFIDAMLTIKQEIIEIENGTFSKEHNVLKNAPHDANSLVSSNWPFEYSREKAAFPLPWIKDQKYWPNVSRIDNAHGDRNLICICPPIESYMEEEAMA